MNKTKEKAKKASKNLRNVLAQPLTIDWPRIPESEVKRCSRFLQEVERKHIVSGCNGVIRLLQSGQVLACFILDSFNPKVFGKLIIQMARKRNPSVLVLAVPSFPVDCGRNSTFLAVTKLKENEQSDAVQALLSWMKDVSLRNGFITQKQADGSTIRRKKNKPPPAKKSAINVPMTDEEVAKFYVYGPAVENKQAVKRFAQDTEDFISFSDTKSDVSVSRDKYQQPVQPRTKKLKPVKSTYVPLKVNRVQGNPNRVEHKKTKQKKKKSKK
ncbi:uncharacterized protein LOC120893661 [Anopheles arabiensis]|uniref:Uncharacterized protein n=1 Tax=Anopheles arabiensis TaxID=7173 RepID=A0A182HTL1_ANOAR|nr:uncharacterized protein LOC120893661 [Anopheles arabiensis]